MRNDFESNYLAHHGILGQRWGKKNGPPYPLDAGEHSSSEKKAGWRESLEKKKAERKKNKEQKSFAKQIKKATKGKYTTNDASKAIDSLVRNKVTDEQRKELAAKMKQMNDDQNKATKEYSREFNKEYDKRFKDKKPSEHELEKLYDDISDRTIGSKASDKAFKSWDEYVQYSKKVTNDLIGKYGDKQFTSVNPARYNHLINRVLQDIGDEELKKFNK